MIIGYEDFNVSILYSKREELSFAKESDICYNDGSLAILAQKHLLDDNEPYNIIVEKVGPIESIQKIYDTLYTFVAILSIDYNVKSIVCICKKNKWNKLIREWARRMPIHEIDEKESLVFNITNLYIEKEFRNYYEYFKKNEKIGSEE